MMILQDRKLIIHYWIFMLRINHIWIS